MFKSLSKASLFFIIMLGLVSSEANSLDIPFQIPNVADPGQIQKNIQMQTIPQKAETLPSVVNKVQPHALIQGGESVYFKLNKVIITGNTVVPERELQAIFASSIGKKISIADFQALVQKITVLYRERGYILSRALLPPQEIKHGVVKIDVIEGFISSVTVTGKPGGARKLLEEYGQHIVAARPLNISVMEREVLLANDLPGMSVKALVLPSKTTPDAADLYFVAEQKLVTGSLEYNNFGTRYIGPIQSSIALAFNSIFVGGDTTAGNFTITSKESAMQYYNLYHSEPLNSKGLSFTVGSSYTATQPLFLLTPVEIVGMSASFYGNLTYSMIRSRGKNLSLHLAANYQNVTSTILALPLYQDRIRSLALGAAFDITDRWNGSNNLGIDLIQGFPILGAQMHAEQSRPEGRARYTRSTAYFNRLQPVYKQFSIYTTFSGQYSCQPLLATEQFSIGGPIYGRGYGPSEIVGDEGLAGKLELRVDTRPEKYFLQAVEYYAFYDAGVIWNRDTLNMPSRQDLTSVGAGLRLAFTPQLYGDVYIAKPLSRKSTTLTPLDQNPQQARGFFQLVATL